MLQINLHLHFASCDRNVLHVASGDRPVDRLMHRRSGSVGSSLPRGAQKWVAMSLCAWLLVAPAYAKTNGNPDHGASLGESRDGQHDFDFEIGTWKTHVSRLLNPLTGSNTWVEMDGISVVREVWGGRANLLQLEADGPAGHFEGLSLRLYNPGSHQWSLNFSNSNVGSLAQPTIGSFRNGRGEFFDQELLNGRAILVRFVISQISANSAHFEQSYSDDGGKTWEVNWIATDTRIRGASDAAK